MRQLLFSGMGVLLLLLLAPSCIKDEHRDDRMVTFYTDFSEGKADGRPGSLSTVEIMLKSMN